MSALSPRQFFLLDHACKPIREAFGTPPYLVGTAGERGPFRDVDVRLMLPDEQYDELAAVLDVHGVAFLGLLGRRTLHSYAGDCILRKGDADV